MEETTQNNQGSRGPKQLRWTNKMDEVMVKGLDVECLSGGKLDNGWKTPTMKKVSALVQKWNLFDIEIRPKHIKSRLKTLRKDWQLAKDCIEQSGFQYNVVSNSVSADDIAWEAYIKDKPAATGLRIRITPYFIVLSLIFGKDQAMDAASVGDGLECQSQNPLIGMGRWVCYVVLRGKVPGVYARWLDCKEQIDEFRDAIFYECESFAEDDRALAEYLHARHPLSVAPVAVGHPSRLETPPEISSPQASDDW